MILYFLSFPFCFFCMFIINLFFIFRFLFLCYPLIFCVFIGLVNFVASTSLHLLFSENFFLFFPQVISSSSSLLPFFFCIFLFSFFIFLLFICLLPLLCLLILFHIIILHVSLLFPLFLLPHSPPLFFISPKIISPVHHSILSSFNFSNLLI